MADYNIDESEIRGGELSAQNTKSLLAGTRLGACAPSSKVSLFCAAAAYGAYKVQEEGWNETVFGPSGFVVDYYNEPGSGTEFTTIESNRVLLVAFRGTKGLKDLLTDATKSFHSRTNLRVHKGFWKALNTVWGGKVNLRGKLVDAVGAKKRIILTGHSLGGALAFLAGCRAEHDGIDVTKVITFGQPQVGDDDFLAMFPDTRARTTRFVNARDLVTLVPTRGLRKHSRHSVKGRGKRQWEYYSADAGQLFYINQSGDHSPVAHRRVPMLERCKTFAKNLRLLKPTLTFHAITRYFEHVERNAAIIDKEVT